MRRLAVFLVAIAAFGMGGMSVVQAAVRSYEKLSVAEQIALQESEERVSHYDLELRALDRERLHRKISADEYQWDTSELTFCIQQESLFQNAILVRRSDLPQRALDVLGTMEHGVLMVPVGIGYVVAACPQVLEFLTMIH
jgi:hypothetical protein